jgi:hypothetical protein
MPIRCPLKVPNASLGRDQATAKADRRTMWLYIEQTLTLFVMGSHR